LEGHVNIESIFLMKDYGIIYHWDTEQMFLWAIRHSRSNSCLW